MIYEPIIKSLLETDFYKVNMQQVILHYFPTYMNEWDFKCRNKGVHFTPEMVAEIKAQFEHYCNLRFTEEELAYLAGIKWLKADYIAFLRLWHPRAEDVTIDDKAECGLRITSEGTWLNVMMYEIPLLAIVNEVYFRTAYDYPKLLGSFKNRLKAKLDFLQEGVFQIGPVAEFGLRRRLSGEAQDYLVGELVKLPKSPNYVIVGTSNIYLAKKYGIKPIGTMAHEFVMNVGQGNPKINPAYSNWYAMKAWTDEYGILNGTYLTDTIGDASCLRDMGLTFATLFSGVRHDSGDPYVWGDNWLKHWEELGIDPHTKTLMFSDSLDFKKATEIYKYFKDKAKVAFGIGTYLSNDTDVPALNIVMKVAKVNGRDVAKISNAEGKTMCRNPDYVEYLKRTIKWELDNAKE